MEIVGLANSGLDGQVYVGVLDVNAELVCQG
jgi:hypothetical protein